MLALLDSTGRDWARPRLAGLDLAGHDLGYALACGLAYVPNPAGAASARDWVLLETHPAADPNRHNGDALIVNGASPHGHRTCGSKPL